MTLPPELRPRVHPFVRRLFTKTWPQQYRLPLIPFLLLGVGGNPTLMQRDGIHPTGEGNRIVAKNVLRVLEPLLSRKAG